MILIRNIHLSPEGSLSHLPELAAKKLHIPPSQITECKLKKRSLDARKKDSIHYVCSVAVSVCGEEDRFLRRKDPNISPYEPPVYSIPHFRDQNEKPSFLQPESRPVIVGFGPAGMFAALVLAKAGLRPIVLERGQDAITRRAAIDCFHSGGVLDPENNVQFGEGGAGTFSDGKLNTGTHDRRISWVLEQFYLHGAPESVLYDAKPHIGTDILIDVVQKIRREIISLGGEIHFGSKMSDIEIQGGTLTGLAVRTREGSRRLPCRHVILAIGHSARDTFECLYSHAVPMERKPFAMGVRIEHLQDSIDRAQYGASRGSLPAADYSLHIHLPDGSSVFSFCMCPGGHVFAAASEEGGVVTNGMSFSSRDGENANAALLVGLKPEDFPGSGVLAGMYWQRAIEQAAYRCGGDNYYAPAQLVGDFLSGNPSSDFSSSPFSVSPTYRPGVVWTDLRELLPEKIWHALAAALPEFGKRISGFDSPNAILIAPETRSSSPVRILRNSSLSSDISGLYPCGEGAGYAGGITSAAVDGMRCAEAVIASICNANM